MTKFVILAVPRTGSNLLCTLLNSHAQILCHHEIFNPAGVFTARDYEGSELKVGNLKERDEDELGFLPRVWASGPEVPCVGFKWTRGQSEIVLNRLLQDPEVKKIVLRRRNRVKVFVSEKIAHSTQQWEVYCRKELVTPRPRVHVDPVELQNHVIINQEFYANLAAELQRMKQVAFEIEYETLFDAQIQRRMLEFLDVDSSHSLVEASVKQNSSDLRDLVENFEELAVSLSDEKLVVELFDRGI